MSVLKRVVLAAGAENESQLVKSEERIEAGVEVEELESKRRNTSLYTIYISLINYFSYCTLPYYFIYPKPVQLIPVLHIPKHHGTMVLNFSRRLPRVKYQQFLS